MPRTAVSSYLRTKLYRPSLPDDHIPRPHLQERLARISQSQVAGITAPAGYGKSTLASAWIEQNHCPSAWLSLDEGDNDLVVFIGYFLTAVRAIFPKFGQNLATVSESTSRPPLSRLRDLLINDLDQIEQDFVLVLDDFHLLTNPEIHDLLARLFQYPLPHFHLLLLSRHNLPPQLANLRAESRLFELRAKDLRFSSAEVASFMEKSLPNQPNAETIEILAQKTEGWPVGLRLVTIAIRRWGNDHHQPPLLQVENQYIIDYLVNEVLARQPAVVRDFLLKSAVLDRFCAPLCAAMMDRESLDPRIMIQLEKEGLFIESLDNQQYWYHYHQLFRDMLRQRLREKYPAAEIKELHRRAAQWMAANDYLEDAIDLALAGNDPALAARILSEESILLINNERWLLLETMLNKFPPAFVNEHPGLLLIIAWLNLARMKLKRVETLRAHLQNYLETPLLTSSVQRFLAASLFAFTAIRDNWAGDFAEAIRSARRALAGADADWGLVRVYAWIHLSSATHYLHGGRAGLLSLAEDSRPLESEPDRIRKQIAACFVDWLSGDLVRLQHTSHSGLALAAGKHLYTSESILHYFAGCVHYERNDLKTAESYFKTVVELGHRAQSNGLIMSAFGLALIYQAQNQPAEAREIVDSAEKF
ncbi:MAG: hypothetical protein R3293_27920, partial [Candidatus Promineifilaceae bacterium]|nr:hypothetical protein [Candidatus Promineifilaceae bacterium]